LVPVDVSDIMEHNDINSNSQ